MKNNYLLAGLIGLFLSFSLNAQDYKDFSSRTTIDAALAPFFHGVASGDPLSDRVIIWTRVTTDSAGPVDVSWRVATDVDMDHVVQSGVTSTGEERDFTVKVDVTGLQPNTWYYYQFVYEGIVSVVGRTRTTPVGPADSLRFAIVSCSNYQAGFFNAYRRIAERNDIDAVIHLGDYIYEYETGGYGFSASVGREHQPDQEIISLSDYRIRHSYYKLDPDLRTVHQMYPFITVWDDHEYANDAWKDGAENHQSTSEGTWADRKQVGLQAYLEWMPIRQPDPADTFRIYRDISYGDLVDFYLMDTRLIERDVQLSTLSGSLDDPARNLIGPDQLNWFKTKTSSTAAQWKVMAQQVMMAPLELFGIIVNADQWDGYQAERKRIYDHIRDDSIDNFVVVTGDIHSAWANELPYPGEPFNPGTGTGSVGVEFITTSITSPGFPIGSTSAIIKLFNSHVRFVNLTRKGYLLLDINRNRTQGDYYFVNTVDTIDEGEDWAKGYIVNDGETFLSLASLPAERLGPLPVQPPLTPADPVYDNDKPVPVVADTLVVVVGTYPNPFINRFGVKFYLEKPTDILISLTDMNGRIVLSQRIPSMQEGMHFREFMLRDEPPGTYFLSIQDGSGQQYGRMIVKSRP